MENIPENLLRRLRQVRMLAMDVDGVLTDCSIFLDHEGQELKMFNVRDGHGIKLLRRVGIEAAIITSRSSEAVAHRARELGISHVYQGHHDKRVAYAELKLATGLTDAQMAYIGDDVLDLPVLMQAGLSAAPADAHQEVLARVHYVTPDRGGRGAVRALAEQILHAQGHWSTIMAEYLA